MAAMTASKILALCPSNQCVISKTWSMQASLTVHPSLKALLPSKAALSQQADLHHQVLLHAISIMCYDIGVTAAPKLHGLHC